MVGDEKREMGSWAFQFARAGRCLGQEKCVMADPYTVKKVTQGLSKDKWGVYKGGQLIIAFDTEGAATRDMNRRNADHRATNRKGKK